MHTSIPPELFLQDADIGGLLSAESLLNTQRSLPRWKVPGIAGGDVLSLESVALITTVFSEHPNRSTYLLRFEDGSKAKCRLLREAFLCQRLCWISRNLPTTIIARMYTHSGCAMLEEWVEGKVLDMPVPSKYFLRRAASTFARFHQLVFKQRYTCEQGEPDYWRARCKEEVAQSVHAKVFSAKRADEILRFLLANIPAQLECGVVHLDYCGENLVYHPDSRIISIDNESLGFGVFDYDIARTKKRWSLSEERWQVFSRAYESKRSMASYQASAHFWDVFVALSAARFHSVYRSSEQSAAVQHLQQLLTEL